METSWEGVTTVDERKEHVLSKGGDSANNGILEGFAGRNDRLSRLPRN